MRYQLLTEEGIKIMSKAEYDAIDGTEHPFESLLIDEEEESDFDIVFVPEEDEDDELYDDLAEEFADMPQDEFEAMLADIEEEELAEDEDDGIQGPFHAIVFLIDPER